jgi:replication factor C small subunit
VKYKPTCVEDYICPPHIKKLLDEIITTKEVPTLLLSGTQGSGKTSMADVIAKELEMDLLYINGAIGTGLDVVKYTVTDFVMRHSFLGGKKLVVIDECDKLSGGNRPGSETNPAQDAMKVLIEQTESNARFVLCTNNPQTIIPALRSRCRHLNFNVPVTKELAISFYKRALFILDSEKVTYDKKMVQQYLIACLPDFRNVVSDLQLAYQMYGVIDERLFSFNNVSLVKNLIEEMKNKKFNNIRKICEDLDSGSFYRDFYNQIDECLADDCKAAVIVELSEGAWKDSMTVDKSINLTACVINLLSIIKWK